MAQGAGNGEAVVKYFNPDQALMGVMLLDNCYTLDQLSGIRDEILKQMAFSAEKVVGRENMKQVTYHFKLQVTPADGNLVTADLKSMSLTLVVCQVYWKYTPKR